LQERGAEALLPCGADVRRALHHGHTSGLEGRLFLCCRSRAAGASDDRVTQMLTMNSHYDQFGFRGNPNVMRWILGREPNTFENYAKRLA